MPNSLDNAWRWYQDTRSLLKLTGRLARHWNELPWTGRLGKDIAFQSFTASELQEKGANSLPLLDDLAIVVLFSVFESHVRQHVLGEVETEEVTLQHRAIKHAVSEAKDRIEFGSFYRVLEPFKDHHHDLVAQIDQIRDYRNWVAHGRRGIPTNNVTPDTAFERLSQFLATLEGQPNQSQPKVDTP